MSRPTRGPESRIPVRGYHPLWPAFPEPFRFLLPGHWPGPRSLATTNGVSVDVLSSGYLDVSVRRVCLARLCIHHAIPQCGGFPHSEIFGSKSARNSPKLIAACYVLHRLSVPRHSPNALLIFVFAKPPYAESSPKADPTYRQLHEDTLPRTGHHPHGSGGTPGVKQ